MKIGIIIQARLGSTRLPGKVLKTIGGRTILERVISRCLLTDLPVCVATPDEAVADVAIASGATAYVGIEHDVLGRIVGAAGELGVFGIVRVNADCPFIEPSEIQQIADHLPAFDYVSFCHPGRSENTVLGHVGAPEGVRLSTLRELDQFCRRSQEHVTHGIYSRLIPASQHYIALDRTDHRTIDTQEDLDRWNSPLMASQLATIDQLTSSLK
jgi:spore coat polysaccharide biosynthesis protein SpsF (cytidylyltransferase family)